MCDAIDGEEAVNLRGERAHAIDARGEKCTKASRSTPVTA